MADYYKTPVDHVDVPIYGEYVGAFERLAHDRDPLHNQGVTAATLIGDVLAAHLKRPTVDSELGRLRRKDEADEARRLREQEEKAGFKERPDEAERFFRDGRAGQWKEVLTSAQVARIVDANKEQMERFGYLPV